MSADDGVDATANGELAVKCPACPHPGKNMPERWEEIYKEKPYVLFEVSLSFYTYNFLVISMRSL